MSAYYVYSMSSAVTFGCMLVTAYAFGMLSPDDDTGNQESRTSPETGADAAIRAARDKSTDSSDVLLAVKPEKAA